VFGGGEYAPATAAGRRLIAHELAHVEQQRAGAHHVGSDGLRAEREAHDVSDTVAAGGRAIVRHAAPAVVQRQEAEGDRPAAPAISSSPRFQLQLDPELQRQMLQHYIRWWLGTTLIEGDPPTQLPEGGEPNPGSPSGGAVGVGPVPTFPLPSELFASVPPDPTWVPPNYGSLYGAYGARGAAPGPGDADVVGQLYRDRLRLVQSMPDIRSLAPGFIRPIIPLTWRRDIAGALTGATIGSGLKRDFMTPLEISDRAWLNMTGVSTTIIPLPSISF
jgi:hypothetical protein